MIFHPVELLGLIFGRAPMPAKPRYRFIGFTSTHGLWELQSGAGAAFLFTELPPPPKIREFHHPVFGRMMEIQLSDLTNPFADGQ